MDEMQLIRELGNTTPLVEAEELAHARNRLVAAAVTERTGGGRLRAARTRKRVAVSGITVVGLAAAIFGVIALAPVDEIGVPVPQARADAAQVLHRAAAAALTLPDVEPRPDQFVYTKIQTGPGVREAWLSVDGTRDGLVHQDGGTIPLPGCRNGRQAVVKGDEIIPGQTEPCVPAPAYLPDLPTDADAMLAYLNSNHSGESGDVNAMGKDILILTSETHLRPRSRAALFEAAAKNPGLTVVENAKDAAGRPGVGIAWSTDGKSGDFVFDASSHAYLGSTTDAVLATAIVDTVNQRP